MNEKVDSVEIVNYKANSLSYRIIKRIFDLFVSIIGLIILIPLIILIKIIYIFSGDFHSIFYFQDRIGFHGKSFKLFKIRTMVPNADKKLKELILKEPYKTEWKKYQKLENDPRITKIGKILRKTSLDELPQFINLGYSF